MGFPRGSDTCGAGDPGSIPALGRSLGGVHGHIPIFLPGESLWTEEPGGLQSMRSQRIRHNRATKQSSSMPWTEFYLIILLCL